MRFFSWTEHCGREHHAYFLHPRAACHDFWGHLHPSADAHSRSLPPLKSQAVALCLLALVAAASAAPGYYYGSRRLSSVQGLGRTLVSGGRRRRPRAPGPLSKNSRPPRPCRCPAVQHCPAPPIPPCPCLRCTTAAAAPAPTPSTSQSLPTARHLIPSLPAHHVHPALPCRTVIMLRHHPRTAAAAW